MIFGKGTILSRIKQTQTDLQEDCRSLYSNFYQKHT